MNREVIVAGVGMIPFTKPGANEPYPQMAAKATRKALEDAGLGYELIEQAYVGFVYGDSTAGQRAVYEVGMTGIPSSTSTTTARPDRRPCTWHGRPSKAARPNAFWRWVSST